MKTQKKGLQNLPSAAFFVPCREFFDFPALSAARLFECGFLSILCISMRFFAVF